MKANERKTSPPVDWNLQNSIIKSRHIYNGFTIMVNAWIWNWKYLAREEREDMYQQTMKYDCKQDQKTSNTDKICRICAPDYLTNVYKTAGTFHCV